MLVMELHIIKKPIPYAQIQFPDRINVNDVNVTITQIISGMKVQWQVEEVKAVGYIIVHNLK